MSTLARESWIEISMLMGINRMHLGRLSQESRGLKFISVCTVYPVIASTLARESWIEIFWPFVYQVNILSTLARESWIEIERRRKGRNTHDVDSRKRVVD